MENARVQVASILKRFYTYFKTHQQRFTATIRGNITAAERGEYAWLLLNRFLFLYFLQHKGLLDQDKHYLSSRLRQMQAQQKNAYYRSFLLPFFHEGLAKPSTERALSPCFGTIPALSLALFAPHKLEHDPSSLTIDDEAFTHLFAFLDGYRWQIASDTPQTEHDLTPTVLGYIFEQQINQKQMGAYYTSDDVTLYMARNTIVPYLLHALTHESEASQHPVTGTVITIMQHLLRATPNRYIHGAIRTVSYLPAETAYEYQQRRAHYQRLYTHLHTGTISDVTELITHNLKLEQLALDIIITSPQPEIALRAYHLLTQMKILDPTCGTGAFLIAALRILHPLYIACLSRLQTDHIPSLSPLSPLSPLSSPSSSSINLAHHALTTILRHNLHGIDIMPGAIELCRQQLLLALLAHCDEATLSAHPLPDLTNTIRQGDILSPDHFMEDYLAASCSPLSSPQQMQEHKSLSTNLTNLQEYELPFTNSHHGFDIIIGNPPYIEYHHWQDKDRAISYGYKKCKQGNMYAEVLERSLALFRQGSGFLGVLVPISLCNGARFTTLRQLITQHTSQQWLANFEIFPCRLFEGAYQRLTLLLAKQDTTVTTKTMHVTRLQRWCTAERSHLIDTMLYTQAHRMVLPDLFPKLASPNHEHILEQVQTTAQQVMLADALSPHPTDAAVYYQEATNYWLKATRHVPFHRKNGVTMLPAHGRFLYCPNETIAQCIVALLNSSLFYLWFATYSDGFHLAHALVKQFPTGNGLYQLPQLPQLAQQLETDIQRHAQLAPRNTHYGDTIEIEEYHMVYSKPIIDQIDSILASYYGLNDAELHFILNYDIKYRTGIKLPELPR